MDKKIANSGLKLVSRYVEGILSADSELAVGKPNVNSNTVKFDSTLNTTFVIADFPSQS
jgi:hypothetical protein